MLVALLAIVGACVHFHLTAIALPGIILVLLAPGRIAGFFWRDLLRGLRLLNAKEFAASKLCSERFLVQIRAAPWRKHLIWLVTSAYSRDPEVLALNNLGAAEFQLGEWRSARKHLDHAIELDPLCPLPYFNIAVLLNAGGDAAQAAQWFGEAERLGYTRGRSDRYFKAAEARFAQIDGRERFQGPAT
jgi:tetratricopeptide (TPR) repeat protein